jgi:hypothetical protein
VVLAVFPPALESEHLGGLSKTESLVERVGAEFEEGAQGRDAGLARDGAVATAAFMGAGPRFSMLSAAVSRRACLLGK